MFYKNLIAFVPTEEKKYLIIFIYNYQSSIRTIQRLDKCFDAKNVLFFIFFIARRENTYVMLVKT